MVKTAEFGQPCARVHEPGRCRICGSPDTLFWSDVERTVCQSADCVEAAKREIGR